MKLFCNFSIAGNQCLSINDHAYDGFNAKQQTINSLSVYDGGGEKFYLRHAYVEIWILIGQLVLMD